MTADPTAYAVQVPITDGVRTVNFFNGRLLAAEDLQREQAAARQLRQRLGRALGDGVIDGLEVRVATASTATEPLVTVTAGTALNRQGTALRLADDVVVSLARRRGAAESANGQPDRREGGDFAACSGLDPGAPFVRSGVYLLTVRPAEAPTGRAPVSGLGNEAAACNTDALAEGVSFDVLHLNLEPSLLTDAAHLRNRVAHLMFGTADPRRSRLERDPFGSAPSGYGLLDDLRPACLHDDEVPLALVAWTPGVGIRFVDRWSVRRRVTRGSASTAWPELAGDRRRAEGEAVFLQFQEELRALAVDATGSPATIAATDRFRHLPAAGLLPLATTGRRGYDAIRFFTALTTRPALTSGDPLFVDGARVQWLLRASFEHPPVDLSTGEMLWLYLVRENAQASTGIPGGAAQPSLLFTSGFLPPIASGRYDVSRWDFANLALRRQ
jgi:hypothetical protein